MSNLNLDELEAAVKAMDSPLWDEVFARNIQRYPGNRRANTLGIVAIVNAAPDLIRAARERYILGTLIGSQKWAVITNEIGEMKLFSRQLGDVMRAVCGDDPDI